MSFWTLPTLPPSGNGLVTVIGSIGRSRFGRAKTLSGCPSERCSASVIKWAVYRFDADGAVNLQPVEIGHVNNLEAKVTSGLSENAVVILHPTDRIDNGMRVMPCARDQA